MARPVLNDQIIAVEHDYRKFMITLLNDKSFIYSWLNGDDVGSEVLSIYSNQICSVEKSLLAKYDWIMRGRGIIYQTYNPCGGYQNNEVDRCSYY